MKRAAGWDKPGYDTRFLRNQSPAPLPSTVPTLPGSFLVRHSLMDKVSDMLLKDDAAANGVKIVQGMGGTGKSCIVVALVNDEVVRRSFDMILWVAVGQASDSRAVSDVAVADWKRTHLDATSHTLLDLTSHPFTLN